MLLETHDKKCGSGTHRWLSDTIERQPKTSALKAIGMNHWKHLLLASLCLSSLSTSQAENHARAKNGMVASVHPLATDAGVKAMRNGGNAVDAAIATALTLGVVDGHNSGIGGGCFILIHRANGELIAIDGREMAPAKSHRDMYIRNGRADTRLSQMGALASGVPGALAAYHQAISKYGKLRWSQLVDPAAKIAEDGFPIDRIYAAKLKDKAKDLRQFPAARAVLLRPDGKPRKEGETLKQPDLAASYRSISREGIQWFYDGPFGKQVEKWMSQNGGIMTAEDLRRYRTRTLQPIVTTYNGRTIVGFPPPSSGGIHVAQILNTVEGFRLGFYSQLTARSKFIHVVAEAMKPAFADRTYWLGDAAYTKVPRGLISKSYAATLAKRIRPGLVQDVKGHGKPPAWQFDVFGKHTTHICAADKEGNWVAMTQTVNTTFGSKVIIPGTGVIMNNEMDDFSIQPGVPNAFGLLGAEANSVAPGKRPLSSMSPTIVLKDGKPVMAVGAAGGPKIITQVVIALIHRIDLKQSAREIVATPRFHHQWRPDILYLEKGISAETEKKLIEAGHTTVRRGGGVMQAITRSADGKMLEGASDPRVQGKAAGF